VTVSACTILLIEDDTDVTDALGEVLRDEGYLVATASNGLEAIEYLRSHGLPSVILLDLMMPVMDGYQFRELQRSEPGLGEIPVICISAGAMDERLDKMQVQGAFKKPLDLQSLLNAIERYSRGSGNTVR
jgi:CheY-like chemotaxis protein